MRTHLLRAVLAFFVVLAVSAPAAAQSIIRGKVLDQAGKPVEGATVTIEATESNRKSELKTNRNGEFMQVGLTSGNYTVTAVKDTFKQVLTARVSQGAPVELAFQLSPSSGLSPEEAKNLAAMQGVVKGAIDAMAAGRYDEAITKFNEIVAKIPACSECYYNLGVAYANSQQYVQAETALQKAIEIEPTSSEAYTGLANVYNAQKKFDLAAAASAKAAELDSAGGGAEASYNRGVILWNGGKYAEAKEHFEAAVKADPAMAMAYYQLGMANLNLGQVPQARSAFEGYLKADPNGPKAAEVQTFLKQLPQ